MSDEKHVYDGIEEENNPMPQWWIWLFILTIIFSFHYWIHYQFGGGENLKQEYKQAMDLYQQQMDKASSSGVPETEESLMAYMKNESAISAGAATFAEKCAMCHGEHLQGKVGPNLTDHFWINGNGTRVDIVHVITNGSPAKGMPPWGGMLKPIEIKNVAAFVFSKRDSNPVDAKPPEGHKVEEIK